MTALDTITTTITTFADRLRFDEAELAAVAFLSRYSGRTLDAYRHDLRMFFQWAGDHDLAVLDAKRPHIELYRASMEDRGLAASTIDRRLSTVCGLYRSPTSTAGSRPTRPSTSAGRKSSRPKDTAWIGPSSAPSCSPPNDSTTATPP